MARGDGRAKTNSTMTRVMRGFCAAILLPLFSACQHLLDDSDRFQDNWQVYKAHYVASSGRVIDTGNQNISHSEGQGYGMFLATEAGDRDAFTKIWQWTRDTLQHRDDSLFAWLFRAGQGVTDHNNATDADIMIAWALLRAGRRWQMDEYRQRASAILADIKRKLIRRWQDQTVLLPGEHGFRNADGTLTVNLSYWIFPAFDEFGQIDNDPVWRKLSDSGLTLLQQARFGRWGLPPDWLRLGEKAVIEPNKKPVFGYNAVRIPLYLFWANRADNRNTRPFVDFWNKAFNFQPAWTNLEDNGIDSFDASAGIKSINALLRTIDRQERYHFKMLSGDENYYSASLLLLSQLAYMETT